MSFKLFLETIGFDFDKLCLNINGGDLALKKIEISPLEFLNLAEEAYSKGGLVAQVDALTNAKRAIVCQMDQILLTFGFPAFKWNIPKKIEYLNKLGLLSPSVLRKVSSARNLLEHEYVKPNPEDVELCLDIASLFVLGTKAMFSPFTNCFELALDTSWHAETQSFLKRIDLTIEAEGEAPAHVKLSAIEKCIRSTHSELNTHTDTLFNSKFTKKVLGEYKILNSDPFFFSVIKLAYAYNVDYKTDEAMEAFNEAYKNL